MTATTRNNDDNIMDASKATITTTEELTSSSSANNDIELGKAGAVSTADEDAFCMPTPGDVTVVTALSDYEGDNIYEKLDSFVKVHQVAMVNRSWCLFSIDAVDFLVRMGVSVHSLEVDNHPHGDALVKYLKKKLSHDTSPWIFIGGEFVGGYEDVNCLYTKGALQNDYLSKLTQADKCEKIAAQSTTKPLFWFPERVNAHIVRATGVLTCFIAATSAVLSIFTPWGTLPAYYLVVDFILRILGGGRVSPTAIVASIPVSCMEPKPRSGRPKQFASMCGLLFSILGSTFYLITPIPYHNYIGSVFMGILAMCCGMEGFLDFCLGCVFFRIGLQLKLIPR